MKLSQWRTRLQSFIADRVLISSWLLEEPQSYATISGFLPPLRDMDYKREEVTSVILTATQDFLVSQRFPSEIAFKDLPLPTLEGYYNTLAIAFLANYQSIDPDIRDLRFNQVEQPISVREVSEDVSDWIVDIKWSFRVEVEVEPEMGGIVEPFELRQLTANLWRDRLDDDTTLGTSDPAKRYLDFTITWDYPAT